MIFCWVVLGKVICVFGVPWLPKYSYILMIFIVSEPLMAHILRYWFFELNVVVYIPKWCCVISFDGWWGLEVIHRDEYSTYGVLFYPLMKIPPVWNSAAEETAWYKFLHSTWMSALRILFYFKRSSILLFCAVRWVELSMNHQNQCVMSCHWQSTGCRSPDT